jgi:hypothetical protein
LGELLRPICPKQFAEGAGAHQHATGKVVHEEVQEVEGSGLTLGKCPQEGATQLICTLAANDLVLLSLQGESIETVKTILKSRMTGDCQVRFCEDLGVKFPWVTRFFSINDSVFLEFPAKISVQAG